MGKDSLIKSTSKKKTGAKKEVGKKTTKKAAGKTTAKKKTPKTTKKPAVKTAQKAAPKKAAPKKAAPKKAAPKTTKKTVKAAPAATKAKAAPVKKAAPKPVKKATIKELILKTFEPLQSKAPVAPAPERQMGAVAAPPIISTTDPKEAKRLRALLMQKFSMDEVKAAAKEPEPLPEPETITQTAPPEPATLPEEGAHATTAPGPEKKAASAESAYITVEPPKIKAEADPIARAAKIAAAVAAAVVFLLLSISYNNSSKYYIYPKDNAIEIWKGRFSPKDTMFYMVLHGVELADPPAAVYTSEEVFPLIFDYYLNKADMLLEVPGLPDFEGIKGYLHQAEGYVVSGDMRERVSSRLNNIERMILLYKAEVAISKGTVDSLQAAIKLLKQADIIAASDMQSQEIVQKIEAAREQIATLKASGE